LHVPDQILEGIALCQASQIPKGFILDAETTAMMSTRKIHRFTGSPHAQASMVSSSAMGRKASLSEDMEPPIDPPLQFVAQIMSCRTLGWSVYSRTEGRFTNGKLEGGIHLHPDAGARSLHLSLSSAFAILGCGRITSPSLLRKNLRSAGRCSCCLWPAIGSERCRGAWGVVVCGALPRCIQRAPSRS
jgi:hypothetical protein